MTIVKKNITDQVIEYLRTNIETGNWKIGDKIPSENKLTEILGVSRSSIRVAVKQLIGLGLLESIHGIGTFVTNTTEGHRTNSSNITQEDCRDIRKVLEFRRILETEACYIAAQNPSKETILKLKEYLDMMNQSIGRKNEFIKADQLFHEEICKATNNQLIEKSLKEVFNQTSRNHRQMNEIFGYKDGVYYHTKILKAIEGKNQEKAKKLMYDHLQQAIERLDHNT